MFTKPASSSKCNVDGRGWGWAIRFRTEDSVWHINDVQKIFAGCKKINLINANNYLVHSRILPSPIIPIQF